MDRDRLERCQRQERLGKAMSVRKGKRWCGGEKACRQNVNEKNEETADGSDDEKGVLGDGDDDGEGREEDGKEVGSCWTL